MSIVKFNTAGAMPEVKGGSNLLLWALGAGVAGYLLYRFWWLPKKEAEKKALEAK